MDQPFNTTHACLPVTALHTLQLNQHLLILSGHGSFLSVADADKKTLLFCQRVFASSHVHGVTSDPSPADSNGPRHLLVWGGSSICFARLQVSYPRIWEPDAEVTVEIGPTIDAHDWILDASFTHSASLFGAQACLVTAHNALLVLHCGQSQYPLRSRADVLRRCPDIHRISTAEDSLLYSARIRSLRSGPFFVVAGTAFGNILVWSSRPSQTHGDIVKVVAVSTGHKGATFGVDQFSGWLASCSDDRGVRLGMLDVDDASDAGIDVPELLNQQLSELNDTVPVKPGNGSDSLGEKWIHTSRVWAVKFIRIGAGVLGLVSIGEDAFCKVQQIGKDGLALVANDHYHSGKNIWSLADGQLRGHQVFTGGADGAIVSRDVSNRLSSGGASTQEAVQSLPKVAGSLYDYFQSAFRPLFSKVHIHAVAKSSSEAKPPSFKQYLFISHSCLLALTDSGYLLKISRDESKAIGSSQSDGEKTSIGAYELPISPNWSIKRKFRNPFTDRPILSNSEDHLVFLGNGNGSLFVCYPAEEETAKFVAKLDMPISWLAIAGVSHVPEEYKEYCIIVYCDERKEAKVVWVLMSIGAKSSEEPAQHTTDRVQTPPNAAFHVKVSNLALPEHFEPTSACVLQHTRAIVLGSRQSAIAIYRPLLDKGDAYRLPLYHIPLPVRHIHGVDSVTSISGISSPEDYRACKQEAFLTTGRNGEYVVHSAYLEDDTLASEILDVSSTPFGSGIEGFYCAEAREPIERSSELQSRLPFWSGQWQLEGNGRVNFGDLILYGFSSKRFVVWNESRQSLIFSVDCENAHRPWAYNTYAETNDKGSLSIPHHGPFVWTQAGSFNATTIFQADHSIIQHGGHGREIKALSVSPLLYQDLRHGILGGRLIVTGAEDTTIRFFAMGLTTEADARNKLQLIRTLKKHTTGIQHLSFSTCGRYLFSSGGREELYAWRIRYGVPGVNLGIVLDCTFPKEADESDLRITDFKVESHGPANFLLCAVYSNSMIKFFRFKAATPNSTQSCEVLHRFFYTDRCLTQINDYAEYGTLTASTDGRLAFWSTRDGDAPYKHQVHQNSIQTMLTLDLPSRANGLHDRLVITGGDDNALGLTLMRTSISLLNRAPACQSLLLPTAHAAAITAICLQSNRSASDATEVHIRFLSAGNDQRVKLWSVTVSLDRLGRTWPNIGGEAMAALDVDLLADTGTAVADVGAMELVSDLEREGEFMGNEVLGSVYAPKPRKTRVLVVGVGMEVLQFTL